MGKTNVYTLKDEIKAIKARFLMKEFNAYEVNLLLLNGVAEKLVIEMYTNDDKVIPDKVKKELEELCGEKHG